MSYECKCRDMYKKMLNISIFNCVCVVKKNTKKAPKTNKPLGWGRGGAKGLVVQLLFPELNQVGPGHSRLNENEESFLSYPQSVCSCCS